MQPTTTSPWWKIAPWTLGLCALMLVMNLGLFLNGSEPSGPWIAAKPFSKGSSGAS